MKKSLFKIFFSLITILLISGGLIISKTSNAVAVNPTSCYQSMGWCGWHWNYLCKKEKTAEMCREYLCQDCGLE